MSTATIKFLSGKKTKKNGKPVDETWVVGKTVYHPDATGTPGTIVYKGQCKACKRDRFKIRLLRDRRKPTEIDRSAHVCDCGMKEMQAKTPEAAYEILKRWEKEWEDGEFVAGSDSLLRDYAEKVWLPKLLNDPNVAGGDFSTELRRCRYYVIPDLGDERLCKITAKLAQDWVNELSNPHMRKSQDEQQEGEEYLCELSPRTVKNLADTLRRILNDAVQDGLIARNPIAANGRRRVLNIPTAKEERALVVQERKKKRAWSPEQTEAWITTCKGLRHYPIYLTGITLGLRPGEICALTWRDYDSEASTLRVDKAIADSKKLRKERIAKKGKKAGVVDVGEVTPTAAYGLGPTKGHTQDTMLVPPQLKKVLDRLKEKAVAAGTYDLSGYIFPAQGGGFLKPPALYDRWYRDMPKMTKMVREATGVELHKISCYGHRHTCATYIYNRGDGLEDVARQLRHSPSVGTSLASANYAQEHDDRKEARAARLANYLPEIVFDDEDEAQAEAA